MSKQLDMKVERDHLISLTKANAKSAIAELIWNSLDADSTKVDVIIRKNSIGIESLTVYDDGHGIDIVDAEKVFGTLGGSIKKSQQHSPNNRVYHGKEGKGRFKAMALGSLITFESRFRSGDSIKSFSITWNKGDLNHPVVGDITPLSKNKKISTGATITIENIDQTIASNLFRDDFVNDLELEFAVYSLTYPNFKVSLDGVSLDFKKHILNSRISDEQISVVSG